MSEIHIGKSMPKVAKREVELFLHIQLIKPIAGVIPTPTSAIDAQLQQSEKDSLSTGQLIEKRQTIVLKESQSISDPDVEQKIKQIWSTVNTGYNADFEREYADYGKTMTTQ